MSIPRLYKYQSHIEPKMLKTPTINHQAIKVQEMLNAYESIQSHKH